MALSLRQVLTDLYGDVMSIRRVLSDSTISEARIPFTGSAINIWTIALDEARKQRKLRLLTNVVQGEYPENVELRQAIENLIYERPDGYITYGSDTGISYSDTINRLDGELVRAEAERDRLRDEMYRLAETNRKEISTERHNVLNLRNDLGLYQQAINMRLDALNAEQRSQRRQMTQLSKFERRMVQIGVAMGFAAIVGQGILILVLRYLGI